MFSFTVTLHWSRTSEASFHWNTADKLREKNCLLTRLLQHVRSGVFTLLHATNNQQTHFIAARQCHNDPGSVNSGTSLIRSMFSTSSHYFVAFVSFLYPLFFSLLLSCVWSQGHGSSCRKEITCRELKVFFLMKTCRDRLASVCASSALLAHFFKMKGTC